MDDEQQLVLPRVLVVDDTPDNLTLMSAVLRDGFRVRVANSGEAALRAIRGGNVPDLVLLDIMMPGISGYDVIRELKADDATRDIPVIFLTAKAEAEDERFGLELGAVDYITKPISPAILIARVRNHLEIARAREFLKDKARFLQDEVEKRTREVQAIQDVTILAMASLAETRDLETGHHISRTQRYMRVLAERLRTNPRFGYHLDDETITMLFKSAPLHDIGKVGIPDRILLKPGRLTPEEFEIMKTHTTLGYEAIVAAERQLDMTVGFLEVAKEIALLHHEKWDGSGYPEGRSGEDIPISARLMALADVYDALISVRVYKPAMPHEQARSIIVEGRGTHFDPDVVDAFVADESQFLAIAQRFKDDEDSLRPKVELARRLHGEDPTTS